VSVIHRGTFPCIWAGAKASLVIDQVADAPTTGGVTGFSGRVETGDPDSPTRFPFSIGKVFNDTPIEIEVSVNGHTHISKRSLDPAIGGVRIWRGLTQGVALAPIPGAVPPFAFELRVPVEPGPGSPS
jgi:hypothetical protein